MLATHRRPTKVSTKETDGNNVKYGLNSRRTKTANVYSIDTRSWAILRYSIMASSLSMPRCSVYLRASMIQTFVKPFYGHFSRIFVKQYVTDPYKKILLILPVVIVVIWHFSFNINFTLFFLKTELYLYWFQEKRRKI